MRKLQLQTRTFKDHLNTATNGTISKTIIQTYTQVSLGFFMNLKTVPIHEIPKDREKQGNAALNCSEPRVLESKPTF